MTGIIVGIDGSEHSQHALEWAVREAAVRQEPLTVITIYRAAAGFWGGPMIYPQGGGLSGQATPGYGAQPVVREQPAGSGAHGQQLFSGGSHGEAPQAPVFHGTAPQPESGTPGDAPAGMHGGEPVSSAASGGGEADHGTAVQEEPTHVSGEEHSFEDAGHAAGTGDAGGPAGHDGGADTGQAAHHG